ncbi:hypothetical protein [Actinomyces oris]|uniref:Leucine rich repeat variant domain-containing protein n=1 Tax=Actinomyces oris TaxID=544580 RepID=A0A1Q8X8J9_9ACTO|nr:hypothetical protein [Actinomyces oris]OLO76659.1 hypothetical protein BKH15_07075 [Actinomyces oris]
MDPVQLMMAAHQADATVAAQTPDQALQAAIAQSRPDLWAPLSTNPAAYPDLLGWLASTGNVEVLANLRARGYLTDDAAASAAGGVGDAGAAAVSAAGEPTVDPAFSQGDPAQTEPTESAESAGDGGTPVDEDEAADEPGPVDGDEVEGVAGADFGEAGDNQDAEEPVESPDAVEDAQTTESADETATEPDAEDAAEETVDAEDPGEAGDDQKTDEPAEGAEDAEAESQASEDPHVKDAAVDESADERSAEPADEAEEPGTDESDEDSEDVEDAEAESPDSEDQPAEDSGAAEDAADGDSGEAGVEPETEEPAEDSEDTEGAETATEPDAEPEAADEVATDADEVRESGTDQPEDEASEEQAAEDTVVDESADERVAEPSDAAEEPGTDEPAEDSDAAEAATEPDAEAEGAVDEAADSDNNDTTFLAPASQWHEVDSADTTDVTASAQSAAVTSGWTAGSAESVAFPVPPPPSAEDIAAWAETPSGAPSGFSAAQPAVELDMFGPQMVAQMPPPQQKQPSKSSSGRLVAIIVVLLLVIVGGGGLWAGSYFANKDKSGDTSQDKADSDGGEDGKQNGQADAAATSTAAALPSGAVKACSSMPTFTITSVEDGQGELKVHGNMATSCAEGDFLAGSSSQVLVYSSTSPTGGADVDHLVASGTFDLSSDPLIIPNGGRAVTLRFGEQHYFRTAKDLDLKGLTVRPSFDRGSSSTATAKSSTNSAMTIASSASSNANQEAQDEQAAGDAIQWQIKHDYPIVMNSLRGKWTPQLSSKQVGLVADGQTWTKRSILAEYLKTQQANPKAVIIDTSQWPVYDTGGWWVTLQGDTYSDGDQANAWCDAQGYDSDHCLAKRIESNGTSQGTTKLR